MNYLIILGLAIGIITDLILAFLNKSKKQKIRIFNFNARVHHSVLGIISIIIGLFYNPFLFVSFGIGIILSHTIRTNKFVFIKKIK